MMDSRVKKRRTLPDARKQEIREAFDLFDSDQDTFLSYYECKVAMRALGFDVKKGEVLKIIRQYKIDDKDIDKISYSDFEEVVTDWMLNRDPKEEMLKAFRLFDEDETGKISFRNLKRVARELGEDISEEELHAMIDEFDVDGDGEINEEEFLTIMLGDDI
ncbi:centrin-3-like [Limulus polyphemus]|uniref:Centrin-3-like n=1 Tax=Limulus polyphemus TaxID=6850 RepID=A0ABM1BQX6_LIMPO|nr:centrin-3-like [Limulus polyphemus]XP_022255243.1 centrin-3-like [Limulus polyphemus]